MNILEARNVTKSYGHIMAINNVDLIIPRSTIFGLIGPNGSGKTTFIDLVTGFLTPDIGDLFFNGNRISGRQSHEISRLGIARTFQECRVFRNMTVIENLLVASPNLTILQSKQKAHDMLGFIGLSHLGNEYSDRLSYGQQRLLELARALMSDPELILLDEPTASIDSINIERFLEYFKRLRDQGKTLLIVEHNLDVINAVCERVAVLHNGQKIAEGTPTEIQQNGAVQDAYLGCD